MWLITLNIIFLLTFLPRPSLFQIVLIPTFFFCFQKISISFIHIPQLMPFYIPHDKNSVYFGVFLSRARINVSTKEVEWFYCWMRISELRGGRDTHNNIVPVSWDDYIILNDKIRISINNFPQFCSRFQDNKKNKKKKTECMTGVYRVGKE